MRRKNIVLIRNAMVHPYLNVCINVCCHFLDWEKHVLHSTLLACLLLSAATLISGCAMTQDYQRPQVDIPNTWRIDYETASNLADTVWWENFQDPGLNELIKIALNENKDLRIATARIEAFAGRIQKVQSGFYPQLNYGVSTSRERQSLERMTTAIAQGRNRSDSTYQGILNVNWELDIWGRLQRATEAARADLLSAEEGRQAVILTLVSNIAIGYFNLLSLDKQLEISKRTLTSRLDWLELFEKKIKGGQISNLEFAQVKSAYGQAATYIPILERQISLQENSLSVLLGRSPGDIKRSKAMELEVIPRVPQGVPSDLLQRRPDIRQCEQNLIAANARAGIAQTQYLPSISLTGLFGFASASLSDLLQKSANLWQAGVRTIGPIYEGGRHKGEIRQAEAEKQQSLNEYLKTIQVALREVNDALISIKKFRELIEIETFYLNGLEDYVRFSHDRYDAGFSTYLTIMDSERELYEAEIRRVQTQKDILEAIVGGYKATGGGWEAKTNSVDDGLSLTTEN